MWGIQVRGRGQGAVAVREGPEGGRDGGPTLSSGVTSRTNTSGSAVTPSCTHTHTQTHGVGATGRERTRPIQAGQSRRRTGEGVIWPIWVTQAGPPITHNTHNTQHTTHTTHNNTQQRTHNTQQHSTRTCSAIESPNERVKAVPGNSPSFAHTRGGSPPSSISSPKCKSVSDANEL